jgi:hypothetical protein
VRFSAVLTRYDQGWLFRQVQFQWDERGPSSSDLFHPGAYIKLIKLVLRRITGPPAVMDLTIAGGRQGA